MDVPGIRTFICCELPAAVLDPIAALISSLKNEYSGIRWVRPQGLHLTLRFLGDVENSKIKQINQMVKEASRYAFQIRVNEFGAFPNLRRPRVYWLGISEPSGSLRELHQNLQNGLVHIGYEPEIKPFKPHLTLGRVKDRNAPVIDAAHCKAIENIPAATIDSITVMKSELTPSGAVHTPLCRIPLERPGI